MYHTAFLSLVHLNVSTGHFFKSIVDAYVEETKILLCYPFWAFQIIFWLGDLN